MLKERMEKEKRNKGELLFERFVASLFSLWRPSLVEIQVPALPYSEKPLLMDASNVNTIQT